MSEAASLLTGFRAVGLSAPQFPSSGCPCIDAGAHLLSTYPSTFTTAAVAASPCDGFEDNTGHCLPAGTASSCQVWEASTPTCLSSGSAWCERAWCYVDSNRCDVAFETGAYKYRGIAPSPQALHFSYEACGYIDSYGVDDATLRIREQMRNLTVRVTAPEVANPTPMFWRVNATSGELDPRGELYEGALPPFLTFLEKNYGVNLKLQRLSPEAIARGSATGNTWWGCVHEVAVEATDMCLGDFWATPSRTTYMAPHGAFTAPFDKADYVLLTELVAVTKSTVSFADALQSPFHPFTSDLWFLILACIVLHGVAYHFAEYIGARTRERYNLRKTAFGLDDHGRTVMSRQSSMAASGKRRKIALRRMRSKRNPGPPGASGDALSIDAKLHQCTSTPADSSEPSQAKEEAHPKGRHELVHEASIVAHELMYEDKDDIDARATASKDVDPQARTTLTALYATISLIRPTTPVSPTSQASRVVHLGYKFFLLAVVTCAPGRDSNRRPALAGACPPLPDAGMLWPF